MRCKSIKSILLTVVFFLVEPSTAIAKPKDSTEEYFSIRQSTWTVTSINTVIDPSLSSSFSFNSLLRSNSRSQQWTTVESYVGNSAEFCGKKNRTEKFSAHKLETVFPSSTSLRVGMFLSAVPVSFEKLLLKQSRASRSENSLITIHLLYWLLLTP